MLKNVRQWHGHSGNRAGEKRPTTLINLVKQLGQLLPDAHEQETIPEVSALDELETFVGSKKQYFALDSR